MDKVAAGLAGTLGLGLVVFGLSRLQPESALDANWYLVAAGSAVMLVTGPLYWLVASIRSEARQSIRRAMILLGGTTVAGLLGFVAVAAAERPSEATDCARDQVTHRIACSSNISDFSTAQDHALLIVGLATTVVAVACLIVARSVANEAAGAGRP